jgi:FkbM family methyltransferase
MLLNARSLLRRAVRAYTLHFPIGKGKGRLVEATRRWTTTQEPLTATVGDGYQMQLELSDLVQRGIYFSGYYEPEFARLLKVALRPGDTFVDCGANVGQFSIIAARRVTQSGRVISIEPEPRNCAQLKTNLKINGLTNALVFELALSDQRGEMDFFIRGPEAGFTNRGVHSFYEHDDWLNPLKITTRVALLDDLLQDEASVDVIKMDIEGAELNALKGAVRTLSRFDPLIFLEANEICTRYFGHSTADVKAWLLEQGFSLARLQGDHLEPVADGAEVDSLVVAYKPGRRDRLAGFFGFSDERSQESARLRAFK